MATLNFPPPSNADDFDRLVRQIVELKFGAEATRYGRSGQAQHGVDITLSDTHSRLIGVQSKNTVELTTTMMDSELDKLSGAPFTLNEYIFATTAPSATHHTDHAIKLGRIHAPLKITVWAWGHINDLLNSMPSVAIVYAALILPPLDPNTVRAEHAVYLRRALDRPALLDGPHSERSFDHQCDALRDVLGFLATGNLYDRQGILAFSVLPYHNFDSYGQELGNLKKLLDNLLKFTRKYLHDLTTAIDDNNSPTDLSDKVTVRRVKLFIAQDERRHAILRLANKIFNNQDLPPLPIR